MEQDKIKEIHNVNLSLDTYIGYDWTEEDNAAQGEWTGRGNVGADGHERSEDTEKAYCENQLKLKKDKNGKLINKGKVFVWKGPGAEKRLQFPGCSDRWCCQKKTRKCLLYNTNLWILITFLSYFSSDVSVCLWI